MQSPFSKLSMLIEVGIPGHAHEEGREIQVHLAEIIEVAVFVLICNIRSVAVTVPEFILRELRENCLLRVSYIYILKSDEPFEIVAFK